MENEESVIAKLGSGVFTAQKPISRHEKKFKSKAYAVIDMIYQGETIIRHWYRCTRCLKVFWADTSNGTGQLHSHAKNERNKCIAPNVHDTSYDKIQISSNDLAIALKIICDIGYTIGPVSEKDIAAILPNQIDNICKIFLILKLNALGPSDTSFHHITEELNTSFTAIESHNLCWPRPKRDHFGTN